MENIKEEKAKECKERFLIIEGTAIESIDPVIFGFDAGFEAGKQEERKSKWISAEEKPEYDGYYLCVVLYPQLCGNTWKRQEVMYLDQNEWLIANGTVIHWQSLPELPI